MNPPEADLPIDSDLVAYLDGELELAKRSALEARLAADAALRARLERLRGGARPFAGAFDILLRNAPEDRLAAILARAEAGAAIGVWRTRRRLALVAAAVFLFLFGAAAGYLLPRATESPGEEVVAEVKPPDGWRQVVAEYLTLYTNETLANIPDDPALRAHELSTVGARLSLDLDLDKVALPDLRLKRAQIFELDGRPLAQIAYLSEHHGPIAFCIIADSETDEPRSFEERLGSNIVYWSKDGRGYMLIGKAPREALEAFATTLEQRVS